MRGGDSLKRSPLYAALLALVFTAACGYRMTGQGTRLGEKVKSIAIPVFENNSKEPNLEIAVTRGVTERFMRDGRLTVRGGDADCVLTGTVQSLTLQPISYDSLNRVSQYRAVVASKVRFEDKKGQRLKLDREISVQWDFSVGTTIIAAETAKQEALDEAGKYLGDRLIELILDGF